jgi:hypothetical protein
LDFRGEHRAESVPPKPNCFVADFDASLVQQNLDIPQGARKPDVQHICQSNDLV